MTAVKEINRPVPDMCMGCARDKGIICEVMTEPSYIHEHRGTCFARMNARRAKEIEKEIEFVRGKTYGRKV